MLLSESRARDGVLLHARCALNRRKTDKTQDDEALSSIALSRVIQKEILSKFRPGDKIPSEDELKKTLQVSKHTLRLALDILKTMGLVQKVHGKGTIILHRPIHYPIHSYARFSKILESCGRKADIKILRKMGLPAGREVAEMLQVEEGEPVIYLEGIGYMDGAPFVAGSRYLAYNIVYDVLRSFTGGSLHEFIYDRYNITLKRTMNLISAHIPNESDCRKLNITANIPVLQIKSVNVDKSTGAPVEFMDSRFKSNAVQLSVDLEGTL